MTEASVRRATLRLLAAADALARVAHDWPTTAPSNCVVWAVQQVHTRGGAVVLTPSAYGPWWHAQWRDPAGTLWEYDPVEAKHREWATPPTVFAGVPVQVAVWADVQEQAGT